MTPVIPTCVPTTIVAGDTLSFDIADFSDYPISEGYALTYAFRYAGGGEPGSTGDLSFDVSASHVAQVSGVYQVRITAAQTAPLRAGLWRWEAYCTLAAARHRVAAGTFTVTPDLAALEPTTTHAERELVVVEAAILDITTAGTSSYSMNGRSATKVDLPTLYARRGVLLNTIWREQNPTRPYQTAKVAFGSAR